MLRFVVVALLLGASLPPIARAQTLAGKLYLLAFGTDDLDAPDVARAPDPLRQRLLTFLARREGFKSRIPTVADEDPDGKDIRRSRRGIERAIVALVAVRGVEAEAERFASAVPLAWEYEGRPDGPLAEAVFAEDFLKKNPQAPIAGYLYLFIAARQRVAFEAYAQPSPPVPAAAALEGMKSTARKYRAFMQRARGHDDPLIGLIAEDIDRQPLLHVKTDNHPRDFDPDT